MTIKCFFFLCPHSLILIEPSKYILYFLDVGIRIIYVYHITASMLQYNYNPSYNIIIISISIIIITFIIRHHHYRHHYHRTSLVRKMKKLSTISVNIVKSIYLNYKTVISPHWRQSFKQRTRINQNVMFSQLLSPYNNNSCLRRRT